jgi:hypothetical protein
MTMTERSYEHTQPGYVILVSMAIGSVVPFGMLLLSPPTPEGDAARWISGSVLAVLVICAVLFASLTITIGEGCLEWAFGPGLIRGSVPLADIQDVEPGGTRFIHGWGIHLTPRGWLYNVSGREAVWVKLKDGGSFLLGTDEPEKLADAIRAAMGGPVVPPASTESEDPFSPGDTV